MFLAYLNLFGVGVVWFLVTLLLLLRLLRLGLGLIHINLIDDLIIGWSDHVRIDVRIHIAIITIINR